MADLGEDEMKLEFEFVDDEEEEVKDASDEDELSEEEEAIEIAVEDVSGEEFMSVKPWKGTMKPPSEFVEDAAGGAKPHVALELSRVFGYRCRGVYGNVKHDNAGNVVYPAAAVGVVANPSDGSQSFYQGHVDDIISIAVDPTGSMCATGGKTTINSRGRSVDASIHIWDIASGSAVATIAKAHKRAVAGITFSPDGRLVASVGDDNKHTLRIHKVATGELVASQETVVERALSIAWSPKTGMISVTTTKECLFYPFSRGAFGRRKKGSGDKRCAHICQAATPSGIVWVGTSTGEVFIYRANRVVKKLRAHKGRTGAVVCCGRYMATGGWDGKVRFWSGKGEELTVVDMGARVRALSVAPDGTVAVGTAHGEVKTIAFEDASAPSVDTAIVETITAGHFDGETWALAPNADGDMVLTGGDDNMLALWSLEANKLITSRKLADKADESAARHQKRHGGRRSTMSSCAPNQCCRTAHWGPNGYILVGTNDGRVLALNEDDLSTAAEIRVGRKPINVVRSGPLGDYIAVATDVKVYILSSSPDDGSMEIVATCRANTSTVTHLDWDESEVAVQTNSSGYELLYFTAETGEQEPSGGSLYCDETWATWTCRLGWPVQGIWYDFSKGSDINTVDRNADGDLLAVGDDRGRIRLFKYPAYEKAARSTSFRGHASHLTNLRFTAAGDTLLSVGGNDNTMLKWNVV